MIDAGGAVRVLVARGPGDPLDLRVTNADGTDRRRIVGAPGRGEMPRWRSVPRR